MLTRVLTALLCLPLGGCGPVYSPQTIDTDTAHWVRYDFDAGESTVSVKIPPHFRVPRAGGIPPTTYDRNNRRGLFSAGYDPDSGFGDNFQLLGTLIHLQEPLPADRMTPDTVHFAIRTADHFPNWNDGTDKLRPQREEIAGRTWFHYEGREYGDSYYTRVDNVTLLWIDSRYWEAVQRRPQTLASRKAITRQVIETIGVGN